MRSEDEDVGPTKADAASTEPGGKVLSEREPAQSQDCDAPATSCPEPPDIASSLFLSLAVLVQNDVLCESGFIWTLKMPDGHERGFWPVLPV